MAHWLTSFIKPLLPLSFGPKRRGHTVAIDGLPLPSARDAEGQPVRRSKRGAGPQWQQPPRAVSSPSLTLSDSTVARGEGGQLSQRTSRGMSSLSTLSIIVMCE